MSGQAGTKKDYLPVFEGFPDVTGFFSFNIRKQKSGRTSPYRFVFPLKIDEP